MLEERQGATDRQGVNEKEDAMTKKPKARKPAYEEFVFRMGAPSTSYSFSTQLRPQEHDAFWEHQNIVFMAECLCPARFKGREAKVNLMGERDQMDMAVRIGRDWKPEAIGWMDAGKSKFDLTVSLPLDACWQVGAAMSAGTITSMTLNGPVLSRGRTTLISISFHGPEFDPLDYIGEASS